MSGGPVHGPGAPRSATRRAAAACALSLLAIGLTACGSPSSAGGPAAGSAAASSSSGAGTGPGASSGKAPAQKVLQGKVDASYASTPPPLAGPATAWATSVTEGNQASDVLRGASSWPGAAQASVNLYAMWDAKDLYIGATVFQDHPYSNTYTGANVWQGDALWIYLTPSVGATANSAKLTFVQAADGPEVWDWIHNNLLTDVSMKLIATKDQYWTAGAIPWSDLGFNPSANATFGINVGIGFGTSGFIDLNGNDPDSDSAGDAVVTLEPPPGK